MTRDPLKHKPLVEAIFEIRWALASMQARGGLSFPAAISAEGIPVATLDPHFRLVLGRLYDRVQAEYPQHEPLPTAFLPDALVARTVQHRFRHKESWPLIQLGPGIMTVNDTASYKWEDFKPRSVQAVSTLFATHPEPAQLKIESLVLRYMDAVDFNHSRDDITRFVHEKMGVACGLPPQMFDGTAVRHDPLSFRWEGSYRCQDPHGTISLVFNTGAREGRNALIWETIFTTAGSELPTMPDGFEAWLEAAHTVTDDWFYKLIEGGTGELRRRFDSAD